MQNGNTSGAFPSVAVMPHNICWNINEITQFWGVWWRPYRTRRGREINGALEKMFAEVVEEGTFEVARRDESGKPIGWKLRRGKRH